MLTDTIPLPWTDEQWAMVQRVVQEHHVANPERTVDVRHVGDLTGEWDTERFAQGASNLIGNAIQHGTAESCEVRIQLDGESADVVLAVYNAGPPIPPDLLPTIFDPLVHGTPPALQRQRRPGSIGLGLYIAREVVNAHGGSIDVQSTEQAGTVFTARLPRRPPRPAAPAAPAAGGGR